jgi:hypothetical protein
MSGSGRLSFLSTWSLSRLVVLLLLGGLVILLIDIRWEHRVELGRQWETWIPIVYIGLMLVAGAVGLYRWAGWGPKVLQVGFALAIVVGLLGVWFHGGKAPFDNLMMILTAWKIPPGTNGGVRVSSEPPMIAPLSFVGVGLLGLLACAKRFRTR